MSANGTRPASTNAPAAFPKKSVIPCRIGPITFLLTTARIVPRIPNEKLSTNISKPSGVAGCKAPSTFFCTHAAKGPMAIAPKN